MASERQPNPDTVSPPVDHRLSSAPSPPTHRNSSATSSTSTSSCRLCCCRFPNFVGSTFKSDESNRGLPKVSDDSDYKPYFELETEVEKISYEYLRLLAQVTFDEAMEKHRERVLEELQHYRLGVLLGQLRLLESDGYRFPGDCVPELKFSFSERDRLRMKTKRRIHRYRVRK